MTTNNLKITDAIHFKEKGQASNLWRVSEEIGSMPWGRNLTVQDWTKEGQGSIKLVKEKTSIFKTVGKVILMATVVIPLFALICKAYFRSKYKFEVVESASAPSFEALKNQNQAETATSQEKTTNLVTTEEKEAKEALIKENEALRNQAQYLMEQNQALKNQNQPQATRQASTKTIMWDSQIQNNFQAIVQPLIEELKGDRFLVMACPSDRFEEFLDAEQRMQLAACDALVVLRWGLNVAPGTTKYIDASGMVTKQIPIIQIQYTDDQAKIISQPML